MKWLQPKPLTMGKRNQTSPTKTKQKTKNYYVPANIWAALRCCMLLESIRKTLHCHIKPSKLSNLLCKNKITKLTSKAQSEVEVNPCFDLQSNSAGGPLHASNQCLQPGKKQLKLILLLVFHSLAHFAFFSAFRRRGHDVLKLKVICLPKNWYWHLTIRELINLSHSC